MVSTPALKPASNGVGHVSARPAIVAALTLLLIIAVTVVSDWYNMNMTSTSMGLDESSSRRVLYGGQSESYPQYPVLFPVLILLVGVIIYYIFGRFFHHVIPYTAGMFIFGTVMGLVLIYLPENQCTQSFRSWSVIDGHVLMLVFLPGLLFKDAYSLDLHLFKEGFSQCALLAFPGVLTGTVLTASVLIFIINPIMDRGHGYWSDFTLYDQFIHASILGAILSATDPVAVSTLLNEVGAPPRLKTLIAGESLLNDGAAVVFFNIFYNMDLYLTTGGIHGETYNWATGFAYFAKLSLGSAALGIGFGLVLVFFMWTLRQRHNHEENVVQIMATLGFAYLSFYVSESVCKMSGIITVVFCGFTTKAFSHHINSHFAMENFWALLEHILNTIIFALGGLIWGTVIMGKRETYAISIDATEWGLLFLLYLFVLIIRGFILFGFYPIMSRIGLKTNWQETLFMSWGGLRGAVGIALGIVIESAWHNVKPEDLATDYLVGGDLGANLYAQLAQIHFFFAGGIAFLTLVINGTTAGPLIKKLGLTAPTKFREYIVKQYRQSLTLRALDYLLKLLTNPHLAGTDFSIIRAYIPGMEDISAEDLKLALKKYNQTKYSFSQLNIQSMAQFFDADDFTEITELANYYVVDGDNKGDVSMDQNDFEMGADVVDEQPIEEQKDQNDFEMGADVVDEQPIEEQKDQNDFEMGADVADEQPIEEQKNQNDFEMDADVADEQPIEEQKNQNDFEMDADVADEQPIEERKVFIALLRQGYGKLIEDGYIDPRAGALLVFKLKYSLEKTGDYVSRGEPIKDWETFKVKNKLFFEKAFEKSFGKCINGDIQEYNDSAQFVQCAIACIEAHKLAQEAFKAEFGYSSLGKLVLHESNTQIALAKESIEMKNPDDVRKIMAQILCKCLLNKMVQDVHAYHESGLLFQIEAYRMIHSLEHHLHDVNEPNFPYRKEDAINKIKTLSSEKGGKNDDEEVKPLTMKDDVDKDVI